MQSLRPRDKGCFFWDNLRAQNGWLEWHSQDLCGSTSFDPANGILLFINLTLPKWRIFKVLKCPMFLKSSFCYSGMDASKTPPTGSTVLEALFIVEPPFYSGSRAPPVQRSNLQLIGFLCPRLKVDFVKGRFMALDATDVIGCSPQTFLEKRIKKDFLTRQWLFGWELSWSFRDILDSTSMFHLQVGWTRGTSRACWQHLWQLLGFWRHRGTNWPNPPSL